MKLLAIAATVAACVAVFASTGSGARSTYTCQATPTTHTLPDPSMKTLARIWLHVGPLWMGHLIGEPVFNSDPAGVKVPWWRSRGSAYGKLRVSGYRLDADAPPLGVFIPTGYATKV